MNDEDRRVVDFAARRYNHWGAREADIKAEFDCSVHLYELRLNRLLDDPEAYVYAPSLVKRLRRLRDQRRSRRAAS